jgi:NitT/TauT family transport system substrate-binding protein
MDVTLVENFRAVFYAPFYAAQALEAYRAEGLNVRIIMSSAAEKTLTSVGQGGGDVSWGGPLRILNALDKDRAGGFVAFCEVVGRDPFYLVGRSPRPAFALRDLVTLRLGVVTEVPTPWICLQQDLRAARADPHAVPIAAPRSMADNALALTAGDVDVIQVFEPYVQELVESGRGHIWYAAANRGPTSYTTFNTTRSFLRDHPELALGMTRAMHRTLRWIDTHDGSDFAKAIGSYFPDLPAERLGRCLDRYRSLRLWNTTPVVQKDGFEWLREAMLAHGSIRTRLGFEECVDNSFAERSVREEPPAL